MKTEALKKMVAEDTQHLLRDTETKKEYEELRKKYRKELALIEIVKLDENLAKAIDQCEIQSGLCAAYLEDPKIKEIANRNLKLHNLLSALAVVTFY